MEKISDIQSTDQKKICKFYQQGYCKFGKSCHFKHVKANRGNQGDNYSSEKERNQQTIEMKKEKEEEARDKLENKEEGKKEILSINNVKNFKYSSKKHSYLPNYASFTINFEGHWVKNEKNLWEKFQKVL